MRTLRNTSVFLICVSISILFINDGKTESRLAVEESNRWHLPQDAKLRFGKGRVHDVAYSPDGVELAVASSIGIWIYNVRTGAETALLTRHTDGARCVAFSPDGKTLACGSSENVMSGRGDSVVWMWDVKTRQLKHILSGHGYEVTAVTFAPDGKMLASVGQDNKIGLWAVATGKLITMLSAHEDGVFWPYRSRQMGNCLQVAVMTTSFNCGILTPYNPR